MEESRMSAKPGNRQPQSHSFLTVSLSEVAGSGGVVVGLFGREEKRPTGWWVRSWEGDSATLRLEGAAHHPSPTKPQALGCFVA